VSGSFVRRKPALLELDESAREAVNKHAFKMSIALLVLTRKRQSSYNHEACGPNDVWRAKKACRRREKKAAPRNYGG
jgi:hypothetical protein